MSTNKPIKADAAGRINLGKRCADRLFTISEENEKIVLEPVRIVSEKELRAHENVKALIIDEHAWSKFQEIMDSDDEPTDELRKLMKDSKPSDNLCN